jgi:glycolate oxidase FAD binding subunit
MRGGELAAPLESALGRGAVASDRETLARYRVDGKGAAVLCLPASEEEVAALLRLSAEAGAAVIPWGGGTAIGLGNVPARVDCIAATERLGRLVEHDDANLTATAGAGMTLASFQRSLAARGQFLPFDAPDPERATLGGLVASNRNGPRRMGYGAVRDRVIGIKAVLAGGERIKGGGKVVKNVAGYDMCKLFVGSLGTLGVITELTFKLAPLPERSATSLCRGTLESCMEIAGDILSSSLLPAAISVLGPRPGSSSQRWSLAVWIEGFEESVRRHVAEVEARAGRRGTSAEVLEGEVHERIWQGAAAPAPGEGGALFRLTVPLASVKKVVAALDRRFGAAAGIVAHAGDGAIWIALAAEIDAVRAFDEIAALAAGERGHAILAAGPLAAKEAVDVWGPAPDAIDLMHAIKRELDPGGILSPGRFVGRI